MMTRRLVVLLALLCLPAWAWAQDIPEALRGTWASGPGACAAPDRVLHATVRSVAFLDLRGEESLLRAASVKAAGDWTLVTGSGADRPRLLLRRAGAALEQGVPTSPKLRDDQLPGDAKVVRYAACTTVPPTMAALHGEGIAFLHALEAMEAACGDSLTQACREAFMGYADVSKDGRLAPAELARVVRGAGWAVQMAGGTSDDQLAAGQLGAALIGLGAAQLVVQSFDYDNSRSITLDALLLDRVPFPSAAPGRGGTGAPLPLELLGAQIGPLRELLGKLSEYAK